MKIPHKFGHIRVNFLQSVRLQVTCNITAVAAHKVLEMEDRLSSVPLQPALCASATYKPNQKWHQK